MKKFKRFIAFFLIFSIIFTQNQQVLVDTFKNVDLDINLSVLSNITLPTIHTSKKTSTTENGDIPNLEQMHTLELEKLNNLTTENQSITKGKQTLLSFQTPGITEVRSINDSTNLINWTYEKDFEYQLEVDGQIIDLKSVQGYFHNFDSSNKTHTYRVRGKLQEQVTEWSGAVTKATEAGKTLTDSALPIDRNLLKPKTSTAANPIVALTDTISQTTVEYEVHEKGTPLTEWIATTETRVIVANEIDAIKVRLVNAPTGLKIKYRVYSENGAWQPWTYDGQTCGVYGKSIQMMEMKFEGLETTLSIGYVLYGVNRFGSFEPSRDGGTAGTTGTNAGIFAVYLQNTKEYKTQIIDKDTIWKAENGPYIIDGELIINQGATLTIEPGTKVIFQKYKYRENGIAINGKLVLNGTSASPIQFKNTVNGMDISQDKYYFTGIDVKATGEMLASNVNMEADFKRVYINVSGNATLSYCNINCIGESQANSNEAVYCQLESGKTLNINDCTFNNAPSGIKINDGFGQVNINNNKFTNSTKYSIEVSIMSMGDYKPTIASNIKGNTIVGGKGGIVFGPVYGDFSNFTVTGNSIQNCSEAGVYFRGYLSSLTFQKNIISGIDSKRENTISGPIVINTDDLGENFSKMISSINPKSEDLKNILSGNNFDAIVLTGTIYKDSKLFRGYNRYLVRSYLNISKDTTLSIEDGTIIHLRGEIGVYGSIRAEGKANNQIVFTSVNSEYTLPYKPISDPAQKLMDDFFPWIYIQNGGSFLGINTVINRGGGPITAGGPGYSSIYLLGKLTLINSSVFNATNRGIYGPKITEGTEPRELNIINCSITHNMGDGISIDHIPTTVVNSDIHENDSGIRVNGKNTVICGNSFVGNRFDAVTYWNDTKDKNIDLTNNYWGAFDGPHVLDDEGFSWEGKGQKVYVSNGYALVYPFLKTPSDCVPVGDVNNYVRSVELRDQKWFGSQGVSVATGNYCKTFADMEECFPNLGLSLSHTYNSKDETVSSLGKGWRLSLQGEISDFSSSTGTTMKKVVLPTGETQTFTVNSNGTFTANDSRNTLTKAGDTFTLINKEQMQYLFNSSGKLYCIKDKSGNAVNIAYNNGKIDRVYDETNKSFKFTYDAATGYIDKITESFGTVTGRVVDFNYDSSKRLSSVTDASGNVTNYVYSGIGLLQDTKNSEGALLERIIYTLDGRSYKVSQKVDSYGNSFTYKYDNFVNRTIVTESNGWAKEYWCDPYGYPTVTIYPDRSTEITEYYLDASGENKYGEIKASTNIYGSKTEYIRDGKGNVTKQINSDRSEKNFEYDDKNNLIKEVNEDGNVTYYCYDANKINLIQKVQPLNGTDPLVSPLDETKFAVTSYEYYSEAERVQNGYKVKGSIKTEKTPLGNTTTFKYDANGNKTIVTDGFGNNTVYTYDAYNNEASMTTPEGYKTTYVYDMNGRLEKATLHGGEVTRTVYDNKGQKLKEITPNIYDAALDNIDAHTYSGNHGTRFSYYYNGKVATATDAMGNTTRYYYDKYGNVSKEIKPNKAVYLYQYDCHNRPIKTTFKESDESTTESVIEEFSYNADPSIDRLEKVHKQYVDSTNTITNVSTFDYANRLIKVKNSDGTVTSTKYSPSGLKLSEENEDRNPTIYEYDPLGRLIKQWVPVTKNDSIVNYAFTGFEYDKDGNKKVEWTGKNLVEYGVSVSILGSNVVKLTYNYYKDGKVQSKTDNEGRRTDYEYSKDRALTKETVFLTYGGKYEITEHRNNYLGKPIKTLVKTAKQDIIGNSITDSALSNMWTTYEYDKNGNLKNVKNYGVVDGTDILPTTPVLNVISYEYDNLNRETKQTKQAKNIAGNNTTIFTLKNYSWDGKVLNSRDCNGGITSNTYDLRGRLVKVRDPKGQYTLFTYDYLGRVLSKTISRLNEDYNSYIEKFNAAINTSPDSPNWNPEYDFNKDNVVDLYDNVTINRENIDKTLFEYDDMGRIIREIKSSRNPNTLEWDNVTTKAYKYDKQGNVIKELDALGYEQGSGATPAEKIENGYGTEYTYNLMNKQTSVLTPASKDKGLTFNSKYEYDGLGRVVKDISANQGSYTYEYNNSGKLTKSTLTKKDGSEVVIKTNQYDLGDNLISEKDAKGVETKYEYNLLGKIRKVTTASDATINANTIQYQYDIYGNQALSQDSSGRVDLTEYDNSGRKIHEKTQKSDGTQVIEKFYFNDGNGNVVAFIDGNGNKTTSTYDEQNKITSKRIKVTYVDGSTQENRITYEYDIFGQLVSETDSLGNVLRYKYDAFGRVIDKRDAYNKVIQILTYNANGTQKESFDALNNEITYIYDKDKRLIRSINGDETTGTIAAEQVYDERNNVIEKRDGNGNSTKYQYDELNKLKSVTNALGQVTAYTYDDNGNMETMTDGNGNVTYYEYNCANKPIKIKTLKKDITTAVSGNTVDLSTANLSEGYTYYVDGNIKIRTSKNTDVTTYTYDIYGRKLTEVIGGINNSYTYDKNDNLLTVKDSTGTTTRTYDALNRTITKDVPNGGTTKYLYDSTNGVDPGCYAEVSTDAKGFVTTKIFDKAKRLYKVTESGNTTTYNYYDNGNRQEVIYPNGSKEVYYYNKNNTLAKLENKNPDGTISESFVYGYDNSGNITSKVDKKGKTTYTYDRLNRVETSTEQGGKVTTYKYDNAGNRISMSAAFGSKVETTEYFYDSLNRLRYSHQLLTGVQNSGVVLTTEKQNSKYDYDENGNQIKVTESSYDSAKQQKVVKETINKYDKLNQLIETTTKDGIVVKNAYNAEGYRVAKDVNGVKTNFVYEGDKVVLELDASGNEKGRNIYGENLISRNADGQKSYYLYNGHGDVTTLTNETGAVSGTYYYDEFGAVEESTGTVDNPFLYAGYRYDKETGNYYLNSRMYDPVTARFLQEDTYRGSYNNPLSLNLYTYCHNNPMIYDDPNGHWGHIVIGALVGAVVGAAINAVDDYLDDGKFNKGLKSYLGAAAEGAITGGLAAATCGLSLGATIAVEAGSSFVGNVASQYISKGEVNWREAAVSAVVGGGGAAAGHYAKKIVSKLPAIPKPPVISRAEQLLNKAKVRAKILGDSGMSRLNQISDNIASKLKFSPQMSFAGVGNINLPKSSFRDTVKDLGLFKKADTSVQKNFKEVVKVNTERLEALESSGDIAKETTKAKLFSTYKERISQTPVNNGRWTGVRGESTFISDNVEASNLLREVGKDGVDYSNAIPDFSIVSRGEVKIEGMSIDRRLNFKKADQLLAEQLGKTNKEIAKMRKINKLTWHELNDMETMQLVPTIINSKFGHLGGVSEVSKSIK